MTYRWRMEQSLRSADLVPTLNEAEREGWEVWQVVACFADHLRYDVLLRRRVPEAEPVELIQS